MTSDNPHGPDQHGSHTAFDAAARRAHAASLDRLSPRVQSQLALRRRAALAQTSQPRVRVWPMLALGSAAALTLAVGLFVMRGAGDSDRPDAIDAVATAPGTTSPTIAPTTASTTAPPNVAGTTPAIAADPVIDPAADTTTRALDDIVVVDDAMPAELLAAEFSAADEAIGLNALEDDPDFYLWLGSEAGQADVTESL